MPGRRAQNISRKIEEAILIGDYKNGMHLDEALLAKTHAVSRTPVREALRMLSTTGLIELIPNKGAFVRFPHMAELIEMFEVMAELEALAARLAARRITDAQLEALEETSALCGRALDNSNSDQYFSENQRFHHLIFEASGNAFLVTEAASLFRRLEPARRSQLKARGRTAQSMKEHEEILNAIRQGNSEKAASLARDHVAIQGEKFNDLVGDFRNGRFK